jgi:vacuolar-type H+-ATPase catalytic subunit A/Vma1
MGQHVLDALFPAVQGGKQPLLILVIHRNISLLKQQGLGLVSCYASMRQLQLTGQRVLDALFPAVLGGERC